MTPHERKLYTMLKQGANSFDDAFDGAFKGNESPLVKPKINNAIGDMPGNGDYLAAQFDLSCIVKYFDVTAADGTHAAIAASALPAAVQQKIPAVFFGYSDYKGGFKYAQQKLPVTGWSWLRTYVYGLDEPVVVDDGGGANYAFPAQVESVLETGDLVIELYYDSGGATDNKAVIIHRCQQVAYGTLLSSLASDRFVIAQLRYSLADDTKTAQFSNQIRLQRQSLFGRNDEDYISPQASKKPEQFQDGIIDLEFQKGIDKETIMSTYVNYDVGQFDWSVFVWKLKKLSA